MTAQSASKRPGAVAQWPRAGDASAEPALLMLRLGRYTGFLVIAWTILAGASLAWNLREQGEATLEAVRIQARTGFEKDVLYRRWNAMHGGVYVPVTETTPADPHLQVSERDIETPDGRVLRRVNPALMTRQVHELGVEKSGVQGHLTSLTPIRPDNAADPWETFALNAFKNGASECSSVEMFRGEEHMRLMRPLSAGKGCLKCHAAEGYAEGDIRGGISVSVPMAQYWASGRAAMVSTTVWHGVLWLLVSGGIGLSHRYLRTTILQQMRSERLQRTLIETSPDHIFVLDRDMTVQTVNRLYPGQSIENVVGRSVLSFLGAEDRNRLSASFDRALDTRELQTTETTLRLPDGEHIVLNRLNPLHEGERERAVVLISSDITARKRAEEDIVRHVAELEQQAAELRKSRHIAMNMLEDAQRAKEGVERLNERLNATAAGIKELMETAMEEGDLTARFDNQSLLKCWEVEQCEQESCQAYGRRDTLRCWEIAGTSCRGEVQGMLAEKLGDCRKCQVFRNARADPIMDLGESFNQMIAILQDRQEELKVALRNSEVARNSAEHAREALARSDQEFMDSFYASADATLLIDGETFVDCNEKTVEMLRASNKEEVLSTHPSELSPETQPDGRLSFEKANEMIATAFDRGSNRFEWDHRRFDGEVFPVEVTLTPVSLFGKQMLHCMWKDISELVEARATAEQAGEELRKLSAAVEQSPATVVITDTDGTIEYVNPRFTETTGYTPEEAIGQNPRILKSGDKSSADYREMWETLLAGQIWRGEFRNRKKSGELYWEAASISPLRNAKGDTTHFLGVKEDITEQKRVEEELRKSNAVMVNALAGEKRIAMELEAAMQQFQAARQDAEKASQSKSEFLANMSHEIRTPMTAILGYSQTLLEDGDISVAPRDRVAAIHTICRNGDHLLQIINDILDISKIEAGKLEIERIGCSPVQLVADVKSLMQVRADAKNLPLNIEYIGGVPETIQSDPTRLKQILVNLIGNAIKFTETGGVRLVTRFVNTDPIGGTEAAEPMIQFDIVDSGIGMTEQQVGELFHAFTQADTSTTRKFGGTGLGLSITKRLAEMLGGDVTVYSKPGEGSTFRLRVTTGSLDGVKMLDDPATAAIVQSETTASTNPDADELDCSVLLAEDGPDNQRLITYVLKKAGAEVTVVESGKLAMEAALTARDKGSPFDVILMDMQMPIMDGYEATGQLRQKGYAGPIIALTAHAMADDRQKCLDAGCDDYAPKPINREELIETIRQHLSTTIAVR